MTDPRYREESFSRSELAAANVRVGQAMLITFGDGRYSPADGYISGGGGFIHANGMPMLYYPPCESEAWRRRIAKATREIAKHQSEIRVRELAAQITVEELQIDLQEIRRWANSLQRTT